MVCFHSPTLHLVLLPYFPNSTSLTNGINQEKVSSHLKEWHRRESVNILSFSLISHYSIRLTESIMSGICKISTQFSSLRIAF